MQEDMYDVWDTTTDFYERVIEFYKNDMTNRFGATKNTGIVIENQITSNYD